MIGQKGGGEPGKIPTRHRVKGKPGVHLACAQLVADPAVSPSETVWCVLDPIPEVGTARIPASDRQSDRLRLRTQNREATEDSPEGPSFCGVTQRLEIGPELEQIEEPQGRREVTVPAPEEGLGSRDITRGVGRDVGIVARPETGVGDAQCAIRQNACHRNVHESRTMAKRTRDLGRLADHAGGYDQGDRKTARQKASGSAAGLTSHHDLSYSLPRRSSTRRSRRTIEITQPRTRSQTMAYAANTCQ